MPHFSPEQLHDTGMAIFQAAGAPEAEAQIVMEHLIGANLAGHDSHGVILIPAYVGRIKRGHIVPGAPLETEPNRPRPRISMATGDSAMWSPRGRWKWPSPRPRTALQEEYGLPTS